MSKKEILEGFIQFCYDNSEWTSQDKKIMLDKVEEYLIETGTPTTFDMPDFNSPKNFKDNELYTCRCVTCNELFLGYKRRVVCKECSPPMKDVKI